MAIDASKYEGNSDLISRDEMLQNAKDKNDEAGVRYVVNILDPEKMGKMNRKRQIYDPDSVTAAIKKWAEENGKEVYTMDDIVKRSGEIMEEEMVGKSISIQIGNITDGMTEEQEKEFVERWKEYEKVLKTPGMMSMNKNENDDNDDDDEVVGGNDNMGALNDYEMDELEDRMNELKKVKDEYDKCDWLMDYEENAISGGSGGNSRLENELGLFFDKWELFRGLTNETKGKIKGMIYDIIKETRDEDGKKLKRFLYGLNKSKMMDVKRNDD